MTYTLTDTAVKEKVDTSTQWDNAQRQDQRQEQTPRRKWFNYWLLIPTSLAFVTTAGVVLWLRRRFSNKDN